MDSYYSPIISEETFAAWLDGTLSYEHEAMFLDACSNDKNLQELLDANDQIEEDYENILESGYELPVEFNCDFDIPQIEDSSDNVDVNLYDDIEPYEQDNEESNDSEDYDDVEDEDNTAIENDLLTNLDNDMDVL